VKAFQPADGATHPQIFPTGEQIEYLFTVSPDLFCIAGFDGYFKRVNPAWPRTLGYSSEELLARPYLELVHPDDRARTVTAAERATAGIPLMSFETAINARTALTSGFFGTQQLRQTNN